MGRRYFTAHKGPGKSQGLNHTEGERKKCLQCNSHEMFIFRPPRQENFPTAINLNPLAEARREIWASNRIPSGKFSSLSRSARLDLWVRL